MQCHIVDSHQPVTLSAEYAVRGLCSGPVSVCFSALRPSIEICLYLDCDKVSIQMTSLLCMPLSCRHPGSAPPGVAALRFPTSRSLPPGSTSPGLAARWSPPPAPGPQGAAGGGLLTSRFRCVSSSSSSSSQRRASVRRRRLAAAVI